MKEQRERKGVWKKALNCDLEEKAGLREPQTTVEINKVLANPKGSSRERGTCYRSPAWGTKARPWYTNGAHHWLRAA